MPHIHDLSKRLSPIIVCETSRLVLRHFTMDDLAALTAIQSDPEVNRFIGGMKTVDRMRQRLEGWIEQYRRHGFAKWAVVLRSSGELIGRCGLSLEQIEGTSEWELGWTFARAHWGKGYATEAATAAMAHSFHVLGHRRLISLIRPGNLASVRVAERLGMNYEGVVQWNGEPAELYAWDKLGHKMVNRQWAPKGFMKPAVIDRLIPTQPESDTLLPTCPT